LVFRWTSAMPSRKKERKRERSAVGTEILGGGKRKLRKKPEGVRGGGGGKKGE